MLCGYRRCCVCARCAQCVICDWYVACGMCTSRVRDMACLWYVYGVRHMCGACRGYVCGVWSACAWRLCAWRACAVCVACAVCRRWLCNSHVPPAAAIPVARLGSRSSGEEAGVPGDLCRALPVCRVGSQASGLSSAAAVPRTSPQTFCSEARLPSPEVSEFTSGEQHLACSREAVAVVTQTGSVFLSHDLGHSFLRLAIAIATGALPPCGDGDTIPQGKATADSC